MSPKIICGITLGDPAGIGPEIIYKAFKNKGVRGLADYVIIGSKKGFTEQIDSILRGGVQLLDLNNLPMSGIAKGKGSKLTGRAALDYIDKAIELLKHNKINCLVTAPVNKKVISAAAPKFSGHTEYIAGKFQVKNYAMMLVNKKLRISLVTRHIPIKEVPEKLKKELIVENIKVTSQWLKKFFGLEAPRIAVCALNPHASDNGIMGNEEKNIIAPALKEARAEKINASGPYPADTLFLKAVMNKFDCVVCMYHDQGLIPLKLTGFNECVNITAGLPFVRTSAGHGTAFDIAGTNTASPASLIEAIKLAIRCTQNLRSI